MKGLLIKDFKLMNEQKNFFLLIIIIGISMLIFSYDSSFILNYLSLIIPYAAVSTITYDEFDNGNAFLFTLPISRTGYVIEKYCFVLLFGGCSWLFTTLLVIAFGMLKETENISDIIIIALTILPITIIVQAIIIPFRLKFGNEKEKIAIIGMIGVLSIIGTVISKLNEIFKIDISGIINNLSTVSMGVIVIIMLIIAVIILFISIKISIVIMNNKEL